MDKNKSLIIPEHASQEHSVAHQSVFGLPMTGAILDENPGILISVGHYLRAAARSHPLARGGHWHAQITKARVGAYSFMLTLEEGSKDHSEVRYLPRANGDLASWYWHLSLVQFHEDSGAQLPVPIDQAKSLAEAILCQEIWPEWLHYAVNVSEPLVVHTFVPCRDKEEEDGV